MQPGLCPLIVAFKITRQIKELEFAISVGKGLSVTIPVFRMVVFVRGGIHPVVLRGHSQLDTQESLLEVLPRSFGMLGMEPRSASSKESVLPAVLLIRPQKIKKFCG